MVTKSFRVVTEGSKWQLPEWHGEFECGDSDVQIGDWQCGDGEVVSGDSQSGDGMVISGN